MMNDHLKKAKKMLTQQSTYSSGAQAHALVDIAETLKSINEHLFYMRKENKEADMSEARRNGW